jgi:hypothetical protein
MRKYLVLLCTAFAIGGCSALNLHKFDPMTVEQIDRTINFENLDFDLADKALADLSAPDIVRTSLKVRHDSEIIRLQTWKGAEEAKKAEDVPAGRNYDPNDPLRSVKR